MTISFVYGDNNATIRRSLWRDLEDQSHINKDITWVILGDSSAIRYSIERRGGSLSWPNYMDDLNSCINKSEVEDLRAYGHQFTWHNNNEAYFISRKLDRAIVNPKWMDTFREASSSYLSHLVSDHTPLVISIGEQNTTKGKTFRFFNHWTKYAEFLPLVAQVWNTQLSGNCMFKVCTKLKWLKGRLKELNGFKMQQVREASSLAGLRVQKLQEKIDIQGLESGDLAILQAFKNEANQHYN